MKFDFSLECVDVVIDGRALKFYPLNFKALRTMAGELKAIKDSNDPGSQFVSICKVLAASANRKAQTITEDELEEILSVEWANKIIGAINELSGFTKPEGASDPKVLVPAMLSPSTGAASTVQSSVPLDGPGSKLTN